MIHGMVGKVFIHFPLFPLVEGDHDKSWKDHGPWYVPYLMIAYSKSASTLQI